MVCALANMVGLYSGGRGGAYIRRFTVFNDLSNLLMRGAMFFVHND